MNEHQQKLWEESRRPETSSGRREEIFVELLESCFTERARREAHFCGCANLTAVEDARDIIQEGLIRLYERQNTIELPAAWLCRFVRSYTSSLARKTRRRNGLMVQIICSESASICRTKSCDDLPQSHALMNLAVSASYSLPQRVAQIVAYHTVDDISLGDLAESWGKKTSTVQKSWEEGLSFLRQMAGCVDRTSASG